MMSTQLKNIVLSIQNSKKKDNSKEIDISGVPVIFPFEPYNCQIKYMKKVIETLNKVSFCFYILFFFFFF